MEIYSRKQASLSTLADSLLCLCLLLLALPAFSASDPLKPYRAVYHISKSGLSTDVHRQLSQQTDGSWLLKDSTSILFFEMQEQAHVRLNSWQLTPLEYRYKQSPGARKNQHIRYDWDNNTATCELAKKTRKAELQGPSYDKLSYQLQLRMDLLSGQFGKGKTYTLVDRGRLKQYRVEIMRTETIITDKGPINTIKLSQSRTDKPKDRQTHVWVAPAYDYLMVKLEHHDDDDQYELLLKSATLLGPGDL